MKTSMLANTVSEGHSKGNSPGNQAEAGETGCFASAPEASFAWGSIQGLVVKRWLFLACGRHTGSLGHCFPFTPPGILLALRYDLFLSAVNISHFAELCNAVQAHEA